MKIILCLLLLMSSAFSGDAYVGVGDTARKVTDISVGVGGVARKVVSAYVGVGGVAQQVWPSGPQWKRMTIPVFATWVGIAYGNGTWYLAGNVSSGGCIILASNNGMSWSMSFSSLNIQLTGIKYSQVGANGHAFVASIGGVNTLRYLYNTGGSVTKNWEERSVAGAALSYSLLSKASEDGSIQGFVMTPSNGSDASYESVDGLTWVKQNFNNAGVSTSARFYAGLNPTVHAITQRRTVSYRNGDNWAGGVQLPYTQNWDRYAAGNNSMVLASSSQTENGIVWGLGRNNQWFTVDVPTRISCVVWAEGYYYACGEPGAPAYRFLSNSGATEWGTPVVDGGSSDFTVMGYGDGRIVAVQSGVLSGSYLDIN